MSQLSKISNLAGYLQAFGTVLSKKAIMSLNPLHVPGKHPVPAFDYVPEHRTPFEAQAHLISGAVKAMDNNGCCFVIGEMGTGKTLSAILSVHEHASRSRRKGGRGGKYRAIVICPDHLVSKWKNEIEDTIPGAVVHCWRPEGEPGTGITLEKWWDFLKLMTLGRSRTKVRMGDRSVREPEVASVSTGSTKAGTEDDAETLYFFNDVPLAAKSTAGKVVQDRKAWAKPDGPEWIVVGRDQIKRQPDWMGLGQPHRCYDGKVREGQPCKVVVTDRRALTDHKGNKVYDSRGYPVEKAVVERRLACPRCGTVPAKKGLPLEAAALNKSTQHRCKAMILEEVPDGSRKANGLDRLYQKAEVEGYRGGGRPGIPYEHRNATPGQIVNHAGKKWRVRLCDEPLWGFVRKPNWWPAAKIVQRQLHKIARYLIVDECHEQKSDSSAQSMAMGKVLGSTQYCLALTGTFIGGYASHLFPLLMRMAARDMQSRRFEWGKVMEFVERYGCIDRIVRSEAPVESATAKGSRSMRKAKLGDSRVERRCRPGIMPTLFSEMVMPLAMFLKLEQFIDGLPGFEEKMIACDLPPDIHSAYQALASTLTAANRDLIANGNMKLMGTMLWTLLSYPDHPWGWEPMFRADPSVPDDVDTHAVGWWREPNVWTRPNFAGVATPLNFEPAEIVLPKERELIKLCKANTEAGDQTWVYCEMTQKRDVMQRLAGLLEDEGLRVGVMKSGDTPPRERETWIQKNGHLYDVMLSHPQLVATGLDLFSVTHGNHNFNHLVFYQTGFNLFRLRQASRRSWRIGQPKDCTVTYLYYSGTSQAAALALMGRKAQAAQQLEEGSVSDEGLAAMGGDAGAQAALVKALGEHIDPAEIQRNWSRVKSGGGARRKPPRTEAPRTPGRTALAGGGLPMPAELYEREGIPAPGVASPLDHLSIPVQVVGEAMIKAADPIDEALDEFRSWLKDYKAPELKVVQAEAEPADKCQNDIYQDAEQASTTPTATEFTREKLAEMFDRLRAGTLQDDEWDW